MRFWASPRSEGGDEHGLDRVRQADPVVPDRFRLTHRHPHVGVEEVDPAEGVIGILGQRDPGAARFGALPRDLLDLVRRATGRAARRGARWSP
jgi:hypothetical protein